MLPRPYSLYHTSALLILAFSFGYAATAPTRSDDGDESALRSYLSANGLLNRGLYDLAEKEYRAFLKNNDSHEKAPVARYGLGVCLFRTDQYAEAAAELNKLLDVDEFSFAAETRAMLGQCYLASKQYPQAIEVLGDLLRKHRKHDLAPTAAALLIEACYLAGEYEEVAKQYHRFESRWPENPLRERAMFFAGLGEMAREDYSAATDHFSKHIEAFPQSAYEEQVALMLAQCRHHAGDLDEAARWYRKVLDNAAGRYTPDAQLGLATLLHSQGQPKQAETLLDSLLEKHQQSPLIIQAKLLRGRAFFDQQQYDPAGKLFKQVEEAGGETADDAAYWLAKCFLRQDQPKQAAKLLTLALKDYPQSELLAELRYDLGIALARSGQETEAAKLLRLFLAKHAGHAQAPDALSLLATIEHRWENYDASDKLCRAFLDQYPEHPLAANVEFMTAENSFLTKDYEAALQALETFLNKHPGSPQAKKARYRKGMALFHLERYDEALAPLLETAKIAGDNEAYHPCKLALGEVYFRNEQWPQAETQFVAYLKTGLEVPSADSALLKLGLARQRQNKYAQARAAYEQLLEEFSTSASRLHALFEYGQTLVALEEYDRAAEVFEQLLEQDPQSRFTPFALNHLGAIAMRRNRPEQAAKLYQRVLKADPDDKLAAEVLFQRGEALLAIKDFNTARQVFAAFLEKHADNPLALQALARLAVTLARLDQPQPALEIIERVEKDHPDQLDSATLIAVQHEKAWCLKKLDRLDEAGDVLKTLSEQTANPSLQAYALLELAEIQAGKKQHAEVVKLIERLQAIDKTGKTKIADDVSAQASYRLGASLFELEQFERAATTLEGFLTDYPDHALAASAEFFCGEALLKTGKHQQAATHLTRVVDEFADDASSGPALLRLGECQAVLQRWAKSEEVFATYLRKFADSEHWYQAQFGVGWARENQRRYDEAITAYRAVIQRHKGGTAARAQFQIGQCRFAQKQLDEAARELLKVDILYAYPQWSAAALFEAGRCFEQMGKTVEARTQYTTVRDKYSKTRWAELAAQRLTAVSGDNLPGRGIKSE